MSFLFQQAGSQSVAVSTYPDNDATDEALLNQDIWNALEKTADRVAVSITALHPSGNAGSKVKRSASPPLKSLTCWTRPSSTVCAESISFSLSF